MVIVMVRVILLLLDLIQWPELVEVMVMVVVMVLVMVMVRVILLLL